MKHVTYENESREVKRARQLTLFDSFGKVAQYEVLVEDLIKQIEDTLGSRTQIYASHGTNQEEYLTRIQSCLQEMKKLENELRHYKSRKKIRMEELEKLRETLDLSIEETKI